MVSSFDPCFVAGRDQPMETRRATRATFAPMGRSGPERRTSPSAIRVMKADEKAIQANGSLGCDRVSPESEPGLVSVIIPTHNRAHLIGETLDSVFAQDYRPIEIVVVDDGSTDDTERVVRGYEVKCPKGVSLRYIRQENSGAPKARNCGFRESKGEFIQFLDSDDVLFPRKISTQAAVLSREASVDAVYGEATIERRHGGIACKTFKANPARPGEDIIEVFLGMRSNLSFSYLYKRKVVLDSGGWDESLPLLQDLEFVLRMGLAGFRFRYVPAETGVYRLHAGLRVSSQSSAIRAATLQGILLDAEDVLVKRGEMTPGRAHALAGSYLKIARYWFPWDRKRSRWALDQIFRLCPDFRAQSRGYRLLSWLLGYELAEGVVFACRLFLRRLRRFVHRL